MSETILITVFAGIFGAGGIVQLVKVILDYRAGVSKTREDRVTKLEQKVEELEREREEDMNYQVILMKALRNAGIQIPPR